MQITRSDASTENAPMDEPRPDTWAWIVEAWVDAEGRAAKPAESNVVMFAASIHAKYPTSMQARLGLLKDVAARFSARVPEKAASLWIFPAGYFGYDADQATMIGFDPTELRAKIPSALRCFPKGSIVCFGADCPKGAEEEEQAWICERSRTSGSCKIIRRARTPLDNRKVTIGSISAAIFVCGEFTGSYSEANGPFWESTYLDDPVQQLHDCRLLVDIAHRRVKGSIWGTPGPRMVHEKQMRRFAEHGAAVLAHHHYGDQTAGRARNDSGSNWIIFRGDGFISDEAVTAIP